MKVIPLLCYFKGFSYEAEKPESWFLTCSKLKRLVRPKPNIVKHSNKANI